MFPCYIDCIQVRDEIPDVRKRIAIDRRQAKRNRSADIAAAAASQRESL